MQNTSHILISLILFVGFVLADLLPQLRDKKNRETPAVWFAACVYVCALALELMAGFGVKMNAEQAVINAFMPLIRLLGGEMP